MFSLSEIKNAMEMEDCAPMWPSVKNALINIESLRKYIFPWGKYEGYPLEDIRNSYLQWVYVSDDPDDDNLDLKATIEEYLRMTAPALLKPESLESKRRQAEQYRKKRNREILESSAQPDTETLKRYRVI